MNLKAKLDQAKSEANPTSAFLSNAELSAGSWREGERCLQLTLRVREYQRDAAGQQGRINETVDGIDCGLHGVSALCCAYEPRDFSLRPSLWYAPEKQRVVAMAPWPDALDCSSQATDLTVSADVAVWGKDVDWHLGSLDHLLRAPVRMGIRFTSEALHSTWLCLGFGEMQLHRRGRTFDPTQWHERYWGWFEQCVLDDLARPQHSPELEPKSPMASDQRPDKSVWAVSDTDTPDELLDPLRRMFSPQDSFLSRWWPGGGHRQALSVSSWWYEPPCGFVVVNGVSQTGEETTAHTWEFDLRRDAEGQWVVWWYGDKQVPLV